MIRFLSKKKPEEIGYVIEQTTAMSDAMPVRGQDTVKWARQFGTLGDGLTQHTSLHIIPLDNLLDFLESLTDYWLQSATEEEKTLIAGNFDRPVPDRQTILFFADLKPKEGKTLYYNKRDLKVSSSSSKQHDKRWEKIEDYQTWMNGSAQAVYCLLSWPDNNFDSVLDTYRTYLAIARILQEERDIWSPSPNEFIGFGKDHNTYFTFDTTYYIVDQLVQSYILHHLALRTVERREKHRQYLREEALKEAAESQQSKEIAA